MENSAIRTELDTIINSFLLSKLNAIEFIAKLNDDLFSNENLLKMYDYLKNNRQESVLEHFYEEQLQSIPVKPDNEKLQKMNSFETLEYLQILREEAFDKRVQELEILRKDVLPKYYELNNNDIDSFEENELNELIGLNYYITNNDSELDALFEFLKHEKLVDKVDKRMFKVLFREKFDKNSPKIHFGGSASLFANMMKEMMRLKKKGNYIFQRKGRGYHYILDNVFEEIESINVMKKPSEIMNTNYLSEEDKPIFKKFLDFLKANFKPDNN